MTRQPSQNRIEHSGGSKLGVIGVVANYFLARIVPNFAVARLVRALGSRNEDSATAAYMALVKLGPKNADRLLSHAKRGRHTASIIQVLGDMGERRLISDLEQFGESPDPEVASAARESIALLGAGDGE